MVRPRLLPSALRCDTELIHKQCKHQQVRVWLQTQQQRPAACRPPHLAADAAVPLLSGLAAGHGGCLHDELPRQACRRRGGRHKPVGGGGAGGNAPPAPRIRAGRGPPLTGCCGLLHGGRHGAALQALAAELAGEGRHAARAAACASKPLCSRSATQLLRGRMPLVGLSRASQHAASPSPAWASKRSQLALQPCKQCVGGLQCKFAAMEGAAAEDGPPHRTALACSPLTACSRPCKRIQHSRSNQERAALLAGGTGRAWLPPPLPPLQPPPGVGCVSVI